MSIIGRTFESAIKKGQDSMKSNMDKLSNQNDEIIDKLNELIINQHRILKKLDIPDVLEDEKGNVIDAVGTMDITETETAEPEIIEEGDENE